MGCILKPIYHLIKIAEKSTNGCKKQVYGKVEMLVNVGKRSFGE